MVREGGVSATVKCSQYPHPLFRLMCTFMGASLRALVRHVRCVDSAACRLSCGSPSALEKGCRWL
eukprot:7222201-Prymnesium_polylepis.1